MNQDWEKWGRDIRDIVQDAVDSQNFDRLNQTVSETVERAVRTIREGVAEGVDTAVNCRNQMEEKRVRERRRAELFQKKGGERVAALLVTAAGIVLAVPAGASAFAVLLLFLTKGVMIFASQFLLGISILLFAAGVCMIAGGTRRAGLIKRFQRYLEILGDRSYCNTEEFSTETGWSCARVRKDLQKMIGKSWFREGHLDPEKTCLMVTDEMWQEYESLRQQREQMQRQKAEQAPRHEGRVYLEQMKNCRERISAPEMKEKIRQIEELVSCIFDRVEEDPSSADEIRKMMEYYLPTTIRLLEAYVRLEDQPVEGENIRQSRQEIRETLDTLRGALETLLDSLFEEVAWDVSADVSVLETMLAQEGLVKDDFRRKE